MQLLEKYCGLLNLFLIPALSGTGLIIGNETIERPFTGAGLFCILAIAWVVGLWKRGTKTGALGN